MVTKEIKTTKEGFIISIDEYSCPVSLIKDEEGTHFIASYPKYTSMDIMFMRSCIISTLCIISLYGLPNEN